MSPSTMNVVLDAETAKLLVAVPPAERHKLELLLRLRLRELIIQPARPLAQVMDEIGRDAEAKGLTPALLDSMLRDE